MNNTHNLTEMFASIQGEGLYLGTRQIFIRYADCNLSCSYCDTNVTASSSCTVEQTPGLKDFIEINNPVPTNIVVEYVKSWQIELQHAVSFTGGEPLLNWESMYVLMEKVKELGLQVLLETNGTLPDLFLLVADKVDIVSMDIKLPSFTGEENWDKHNEFMRAALNKDLYVKMVVGADTSLEEFRQGINTIASVSTSIPLIIQPVTGAAKNPEPKKLIDFQAEALSKLINVRVIPQTHKLLNQL